MSADLILRSRKALEAVTGDNPTLKRELYRQLNTPIDPVMLSLLDKMEDEFTIQKREVQELSAHFVMRHLVRNDLQPPTKRILVGLAGITPALALASYFRRGLGTQAWLFESDPKRYRKARKKEQEAVDLWCRITLPFWRYSEKPSCQIENSSYLDILRETEESVFGFVLDHCGGLPDYGSIASIVEKRATDLSFIETTMLDGRKCDPEAIALELESRFREANFTVRAKDSFDYKGGYVGKGMAPMTTHIWVLQRGTPSREKKTTISVTEVLDFIRKSPSCTSREICKALEIDTAQFHARVFHARKSGVKVICTKPIGLGLTLWHIEE